MKMTYGKRADIATTLLNKKILRIMETKQTNLAISADVTTSAQLIHLAAALGPEICMFKTHIDIIEDFSLELTHTLRQLAQQYQFVLCEDRKFADIGNTVKHQYAGGQYRIADWADLVTVHTLPGPGILQGIMASRTFKEQGVLLLAEMSSSGHLMDKEYFQQTIAMAENFPDLVSGFISQHGVSPNGTWLSMTPGVQLQSKDDHLGQNYITPHQAIFENASDIIIVGRGILASSDPIATAKIYQQAGWEAYLQRA